MGAVKEPTPVKLFSGILAGGPEHFEAARRELERAFGRIEAKAGPWPFDFTDYYTAEMGPGLERWFVVFEGLRDPADLVEAKLRTNEIERTLAEALRADAPRPVNLDPGYVTPAKLALATTKDYDHRLYIGRGLYAEVTLRYRKGKFEPFEWTYPDYATERYLDFFRDVRSRYMKELRGA